jgi:hypothetical protein
MAMKVFAVPVMHQKCWEYRLAPFKAWWRETNCGLGERMAVIVAFL